MHLQLTFREGNSLLRWGLKPHLSKELGVLCNIRVVKKGTIGFGSVKTYNFQDQKLAKK